MTRRFLQPAHLFVLSVSLMLVACAQDEAGPQFATGPRPTQISTPVLASTQPPTMAPPPAATPASIGDLLNVRGTVPRVFLAVDNAVWSVSSRGAARRLFEVRAPAKLLAITPSPGADQVAAFVENHASGKPLDEVLIIDANGEVSARLENDVVTPATPEAEDDGLASIDWSPQGNRLLVAFRNGKILIAAPESAEQPVVLDALGDAEQVIEPAWSPTGESIAYIAVGPDRLRSLRAIRVDDEKSQLIVPAANSRMPIDFTWMPDGVSLLFTEGGQPGGPNSGIDLWQIHVDGEERRLVASAGTVAPVARITDPRPSPDGRSVAYAVLVPGNAGPEVDSVWVRDITSNVGFRIGMPPVKMVNELFWTDNGLLIAVEAATGADKPGLLQLLHVNDDATTDVLWVAPAGFATPVASTPVASPAAR